MIMSEKNIIFNDKMINKSNFHKNKKLSKIDSPKWLRDKKATINPEINDDKCFQMFVELNYQSIKKKSSKNHMVQKIHLNTSLDVMMMVPLDHYV